MNKYKLTLYFCVLALLIICSWDIYIGIRDSEWFNLIALVMSVTIGYLLSMLVSTKTEK